MKGWVYILSNKAMPNLVKVGFSTKDPESRANELHTTGVPHRFVVEYDALVNEPFRIEQKAHILLKTYHENKEWFRCNITTAIIAIRQAANGSIILESNKEDFNNDSPEVSQYRKAAAQGDATAQFNLGRAYANGKGITKNKLQAVYWYSKAAEQGNAKAQCNLGWMYQHGEGVNQDNQKAAEWYLKAAEQGNVTAQNNLGKMYQNGKGVTKDSQKAMEWHRKAAEQGNAYGRIYLNNLITAVNHEAVKYYEQKEYGKALSLFQQCAEQGDAFAQCHLGFMYQYGYGVIKDNQKGVEWYRKAAEKGNEYAQLFLGFMYYNGLGAVKDENQSVYWYRKAAEQGNANAIAVLKKLGQ